MIRMVLSSFYNTLIDNEDAIPTSTMFEIDRIRHNNILFTISTNRLVKDVLYYNKDFPFIDYIISLNGSYVYDVNNNNCIYKKAIDKKEIYKIEELFTKIKYYDENNSYDNKDNLEEILKIEIPISNKNKIELLDKINVNYSILTINKKKYIEITSKDTNPFIGLKKIMYKENINSKEIVSIIGNQSDIEILKNIKKSYVISSSSKYFKGLDAQKTRSNNNKGVENIINKI